MDMDDVGRLHILFCDDNMDVYYAVQRVPDGTAPGDANFDGVIDDDDLSLLLSHWTGPCAEPPVPPRQWEDGDFDVDGRVSDDDLSLLLANWTGLGGAQDQAGAEQVPEPATLCLHVFGLLAMLRPRRKG